jgi:hypothetical protein
MKMFGGMAARVNGHMFAGLFGLSTILALEGEDKAEALSLPGASLFDPMGNGRIHDKVMLPEGMMRDAAGLRAWIARAFEAATALPPKAAKAKPGKAAPARKAPKRPSAGKAAKKRGR